MGTSTSTNLNRPYIKSANAADWKTVKAQVLSLCEGIITSYTKTGRVTKAPDQAFNRILGSYKTRVNKAREARALANGQTGYTKVGSAYEVLLGIQHGDPEFQFSSYDEVDASNKMFSACGIERFASPDEAQDLFNALVERYASHPDAQEFISVEKLTAKQVDQPNRIDPLKSEAPSKNGVPATV